MAEKQQPLARHKAGAISVAIWENRFRAPNGQERVVMKATLAKTYKDKNGSWSNTNSLGQDDIPKAILCLQKAWEMMLGERNVRANEEPAVEEEIVA